MNQKPPGAGRESLSLIEAPRLFSELGLSRVQVFLDLGCGPGKYSLEALRYLPEEGRIIALDLWHQGLKILKEAMAAKEISRIHPLLADIGQSIPLKENTVDLCLVANVLHDLAISRKEKKALKEIARVLKPRGTLAIIEFKKIPGPPGPPLAIRIGIQELREMVEPYGFELDRTTEIGPYHYLALFTLEI